MPVHDWRRVEAGIVHAFHVAWVPEIQKALNDGVLPPGYYALAEQHFGRPIADVLTLHDRPPHEPRSLPPDTGGIALADAPPKVRNRQTVEPAALKLRRTLAVRHISGHRLIAILEILSPANKDRAASIDEIAEKAMAALDAGVHLLIVDLFPPGPNDPCGIHGALLERIDLLDDGYRLPAQEPLTLASYAAGPRIEVFLEHVSVGAALPDMPLFLRPDRYVNVPLEPTYQAAYQGMPAFWRNVLENRSAPTT